MVSQLQHLALGVDGDLPRQIALGAEVVTSAMLRTLRGQVVGEQV